MTQCLRAVRALALCRTRARAGWPELALGTRCNWFREGHIKGSAMKGGSHTVLPSRAFACMCNCEPAGAHVVCHLAKQAFVFASLRESIELGALLPALEKQGLVVFWLLHAQLGASNSKLFARPTTAYI
jgi:hypothetical protein